MHSLMLKPMAEADIHTGSEVYLPVASGTALVAAVEHSPAVFEPVAVENSLAVFEAAAVENSLAVFQAVAVAGIVPMERHNYQTVAKAVDRYGCFDLRQQEEEVERMEAVELTV